MFGFTGFLIGVPVFALIYAAVSGFIRSRLTERGLPADTDEYEGVAYIDDVTREPIHMDGGPDGGDAKDN
jgi:hypothetical protein